MHPDLNLEIARLQAAERLHEAERYRRVRLSGARSDLRTRLGRALVSLGTRLA